MSTPSDDERDTEPDEAPDGLEPAGEEGAGDGFDLSGLLGDGGLDLGSLMQQASQMQAQMASAQEAAAATVLEGVSGGGAVRVECTGTGEFRSVRIDPAAVDPADVAMLEDLVLAALHDAVTQMEELRAQSMGGLGDVLGGGR